MNNVRRLGGSNGDESLISPDWLPQSEAPASRSLEVVSLGLRRAFPMPAFGGFEDLLTAIDKATGRK
jgi:hypothetical protein